MPTAIPRWDAGGMRNTAERVVANLVGAGLLDPARSREAETVVAGSLRSPGPSAAPGASPAAERPTTRGLLVEIAGYVGGALVMASIALFLAQEWAGFSETVQVATLRPSRSCSRSRAWRSPGSEGACRAAVRWGRDPSPADLRAADRRVPGGRLHGRPGGSNQVNDYASSLPVLAGFADHAAPRSVRATRTHRRRWACWQSPQRASPRS